jgi:hypothetical protein
VERAGGPAINPVWVIVGVLDALLLVVLVVLALDAIRWFVSRSQRAGEIEDLRNRVGRLESERAASPDESHDDRPGR